MTLQTQDLKNNNQNQQRGLSTNKLLLSFIAGSLSVLSLAPFNFWFIAPLSTAILFGVVESQHSIRQQFYTLLAYHLALFGFGASWVYVSIHDYGYTGVPLALFLTFIFCAVLATSNALLFIFYCLLKDNNNLFRANNILLFCGTAVLIEASRSWLFSGFPWLLIGYSQTTSSFSGFASVFGVYGLSLLVYLAGALLATFCFYATEPSKLSRNYWIVSFGFCCVCIFALTCRSNQWVNIDTETRTVSLVQANLSQHQKWDKDYRYKTLSTYRNNTIGELNPQNLILWPEASIPFFQDQAENFLEPLNQLAQQKNSALILGIPTRQTHHHEKNSTTLIFNSVIGLGEANGIYNKQHLVPFGEYIPFKNIVGKLMKIFNLPLSTMNAGSTAQAALQVFDWQTLPLVCYEVVFPNLTAKASRVSDVLLTLSNDTWFGKSLGPKQHLQMAQMRAIENGRYMLRSTGSGVTAIIQPDGKIAEQLPSYIQGVLKGEFQLVQGLTPWTQFGYWLIHCIALVLLTPALASVALKYKNLASKP